MSQDATHPDPFISLLAVAFIVLKLCGVINWSWWWVLAPIWGGIAFALLLLGFGYLAIFGALAIQRAIRKAKGRKV